MDGSRFYESGKHDALNSQFFVLRQIKSLNQPVQPAMNHIASGSEQAPADHDPAPTSIATLTGGGPHWLARLPFELRNLISDFIIGEYEWEMDRGSLSMLTRTCKTLYQAFQPFLWRNIALHHKDKRLKLSANDNTRYAELLKSLLDKPFLASCVRSIDFTDSSAIYRKPLPKCHHQQVARYIEWFALGNGRLAACRDVRSQEGYPAQLTVLLFLLQSQLSKARITIPRLFWVDEYVRGTGRSQPFGIILKDPPSFPRLTHLALDYPPWVDRSRKGRGLTLATGKHNLQGDCDLLLTGAPNLRVLTLRDCNLAKLRSEIPATVTSLTLQDCYLRSTGPRGSASEKCGAESIRAFLGSELSLKSLTITFGKLAAACNSPGNYRSYLRTQPAGITTGSWSTWDDLSQPTLASARRPAFPTEYWHPPADHGTWHQKRRVADDTATAENFLEAVASSPSPTRQSIERISIDLGFINSLFTRKSYVTALCRSQYQWSSHIIRVTAPYIRPNLQVLLGFQVLTGISLFPNVRILTINCVLILLFGVGIDTSGALVNLTRNCRSTLETLELTGVHLVLPSNDLSCALKGFGEHIASDLSSDRALKKVALYSDEPANKRLARLVSNRYAVPFQQGGVELVLFTSGPEIEVDGDPEVFETEDEDADPLPPF